MELVVNGDSRHFAEGLTVQGLLDTIGVDSRRIAVERNREIVIRSTYETTFLAHGDKIEIVHFIGGG